MVAAVVAGDPDGLAAAYDQFAAPLFAYCHRLLPDPEAPPAPYGTRSSSPPPGSKGYAIRTGCAPGFTR